MGVARCPPVMTTLAAPISCRRFAALRISSMLVTANPVSAAASAMLGVITETRGNSVLIKVGTAADSSRSAPELDLRMGSSTT